MDRNILEFYYYFFCLSSDLYNLSLKKCKILNKKIDKINVYSWNSHSVPGYFLWLKIT